MQDSVKIILAQRDLSTFKNLQEENSVTLFNQQMFLEHLFIQVLC